MFNRLVLISVMMCLAFSFSAFAQYTDLATDEASVTISAAGQNDSLVTSATGIFPAETINGWVGAYASRNTVDGTLEDETLNLHFQGGFKELLGELGVEFFIDLDRNKHRNIDFGKRFGYFIRPGVHEIQTSLGVLSLSGGAGNYTEDVSLKEELTGDAAAPSNFGWLAFTSLSIGAFGGQVKYQPDINFEFYEVSVEGSVSKEVADNISVGLTVRALKDNKGYSESSFDSSYLLSVLMKI